MLWTRRLPCLKNVGRRYSTVIPMETSSFNASLSIPSSDAPVPRDVYCQPRLEHHYYETMLEDLMILQYDHASTDADIQHVERMFQECHMKSDQFLKPPPFDPKTSVLERHQKQFQFPPPYLQAPDKPLQHVFSNTLDQLVTQPKQPHHQVTTNIITLINSQVANKIPPKQFVHALYNPIDFTTLGMNVLTHQKRAPPPLPYCPIPSRLPFLRQVSIRIWSEKFVGNKQLLMPAVMSLSAITGMRAEPLFADKPDAAKKIREGMPVGTFVHLHGRRMYEFVDKLTQTVLPRLREWDGIVPAPAQHDDGSVALVLPAAAVGYFPDIEPHFDMYHRLFDTEITFHTTGASDSQAITLLTGFGVPFTEREIVAQDEGTDSNDPWAKFKKRTRHDAKVGLAKKRK